MAPPRESKPTSRDVQFEPLSAADARAMRSILAKWFHASSRDLPWRRTRDPYAVWISEAMLQQTRVEVVLDYWPRFLAAFPTVADLADADEQSVLAAWSGLGYYRRARSLQSAARAVVERFDGVFPNTRDAAESLPGIGPYTAGAVLSIGYDLPEAIVDGNVERVFSRLFLLDGVRTSAPLQRAAWHAARHLVERGVGDGVAPRVWNQALMELGALVCKPKNPTCGECPLESRCAARANGVEAELPRPKPKKVMRDVQLEIYVVRDRGDVLLVKRPSEGRMAGLWEFPTVETSSWALFPSAIDGDLGRGLEPSHDLFEIRHGITNHRIRARVRASTAPRDFASRRMGSRPDVMVGSLAAARGLAVTGMTRKVLAKLDSEPLTLFHGR